MARTKDGKGFPKPKPSHQVVKVEVATESEQAPKKEGK